MVKKKDKEVKKAKEIVEEKFEKKNTDEHDKNKKQEETAGKEKIEQPEGSARPQPIQLTFHSYLIMLGAIGWQFLGKLPNPQTGKIEVNLMQVKEIIDLLEILEEKTKNNLTKEEDNILKSTLSSLRLNYVDEIKK